MCSDNPCSSPLTVVVLLFAGGFYFLSPTYGYDPLDPNGNITITWDILQQSPDGSQDVRLSIVNFQLFRHIDQPGWKLSWAWKGDEVIWSMLGAAATQQGNCSLFKGALPHCCDRVPVILDLLPGSPYNQQVANCCRGGVLTSMLQDPTKYVSAFQMHVASAGSNDSSSVAAGIPENFTIGVPGYTCGNALKVPSTKFVENNGRRTTEAFATWNVTCTYSQFRSSTAPKCCLSLSAFYNETIVPCPQCSCACKGQPGSTCLESGESSSALRLQKNDEAPQPLLQCSNHMCPIQVHWHVKQSYTQYWRVKIAITNLNYAMNYSQWNLVMLHPNLGNITRVFSFNYKPLNVYSNINDTGMFYGVQYYNDVLLQSGSSGNVQSEVLLSKDPSSFTFREGWVFPRKISFNGEECVMPSPDDYPRLPNSGHVRAQALLSLSLSFLLLVVLLI